MTLPPTQTYESIPAQDVLNEQIASMGTAMAASFVAGDLDSFMRWFDLDVVSDYYMRRWFNGYAVKVARPDACMVTVERRELTNDPSPRATLTFHLRYRDFAPEDATFDVRLGDADTPPRIVAAEISLAQPPWPDRPRATQPVPAMPALPAERPAPRWWEYSPLTATARASNDYLKASLYARAMPKSTRYRSTHPEIDSAAILADMLSLRAATLAYGWGADDLATGVARIHAFAQRTLHSKDYDEYLAADRSYFPARELSLQSLWSIDDALAAAGYSAAQSVDVTCVEVATFYAAQLRLLGLDPADMFILTQPFHYLTFFQLPRGYYILSVHDILPMSARRLYGGTEVTRIFSPSFYLDAAGLTNMPDALQHDLCDRFQQLIPIFQLPNVATGAAPLPEEVEWMPSIHDYNTPLELHHALRQHIFAMSQRYPVSPFTWAKYIYQTLLVPQPSAYAIWSQKAPECLAFVRQHPRFEQARAWLAQHLANQSIFWEPDRIMTADQVLRHATGSANDRALLLYTLARLQDTTVSGSIVITTTGAYTALDQGGSITYFDGQTLQQTGRITGDLVLAFDEHTNVDPHRADCGELPRWLAAAFSA